MNAFRERRFLSQDGRTLYYREYGDPLASAAPVLCLPGLTRTARDFSGLASRLASTRRVICPDYRGRGLSEYDNDPRNYHPTVTLLDTRHLLTVTGLEGVVVIGTSFGGFLAMGLAIVMPSSLRAVVLNDVGPKVSDRGMQRIAGYIGTDNPQPDWNAAVAELARMFPTMAGESRETLLEEARATWREGEDGRLHFNWDTRLAQVVVAAGAENDPWILFRALARFPVLALRGELSDVLSAETLERMAHVHPALTAVTVPGRGHPLTLNEPLAMEALDAFLARV